MGCEVFKDKGFILKFVECLLIIGLAIAWCGYCLHMTYVNWAYHVAQLFLDACFFAFFPAFIMMILYATNGFNDHLYELVVAVFGAIAGLLCGVFMLVFRYEDTESYQYAYDNRESVREEAENKHWGDYSSSSHDDFEDALIAMGVLALILTVCFIVDAIVNGAQK